MYRPVKLPADTVFRADRGQPASQLGTGVAHGGTTTGRHNNTGTGLGVPGGRAGPVSTAQETKGNPEPKAGPQVPFPVPTWN